jgi:tRNA(Ile2) C34 agmatinyltransferase TiaS
MAVYNGFTPSEDLLAYGRKVKRGEIEPGVLGRLDDKNLQILMNGRGIIGAVAAIPFYTRYEEALELCSGPT